MVGAEGSVAAGSATRTRSLVSVEAPGHRLLIQGLRMRPSATLHIDPTARSAINNHAIVSRLLDAPNGLSVLDVGAGVGNFTAHLAARGYEPIAIDIDPVDFREAGYAVAPFLAANLDESLPVGPGTAGGAVAIEVFEHLEAPLRAMRLLADALVEGGFLIVTTPNVMSWGSRLELLVRGHYEHFGDYEYETNGHISPLQLVQMERMGERLGLVVEHVTYNIGRLPLPLLHQIPLKRPCFRIQALGECMIVKFRKLGPPAVDYQRG